MPYFCGGTKSASMRLSALETSVALLMYLLSARLLPRAAISRFARLILKAMRAFHRPMAFCPFRLVVERHVAQGSLRIDRRESHQADLIGLNRRVVLEGRHRFEEQ